MAIPDYQAIMLPLLKYLGDKQERSNQQTVGVLASEFRLTEEERKDLLESGQKTVFANRVGWAKVYLKKAGLIDSPRRGYHRITQRGLKVLHEKPGTVNNKFLMQFPEFRSFVKPEKPHDGAEENLASEMSPEDMLNHGYKNIRLELADELLKRVKESPPDFLERLVVGLLVRMGYGGSIQDAGKAIGKSGDGGIDGIIKEDKLGLDTLYVQAKRWDGIVGRPDIQKFVGALQGQQANKGVFITTSAFTKEAEEYVQKINSKVILINGAQLAQLMIDHDIGVTRVASYEIKRVDSDYFAGE